jgi:hypothetical protein
MPFRWSANTAKRPHHTYHFDDAKKAPSWYPIPLGRNTHHRRCCPVHRRDVRRLYARLQQIVIYEGICVPMVRANVLNAQQPIISCNSVVGVMWIWGRRRKPHVCTLCDVHLYTRAVALCHRARCNVKKGITQEWR